MKSRGRQGIYYYFLTVLRRAFFKKRITLQIFDEFPALYPARVGGVRGLSYYIKPYEISVTLQQNQCRIWRGIKLCHGELEDRCSSDDIQRGLVGSFLDELLQYTSKVKVAPQFQSWQALSVECYGCCHCETPSAPPFVGCPILPTSRNRKAESVAPLPGRPRSMTGLQVRECGAGKNAPASDTFGILTVCKKH